MSGALGLAIGGIGSFLGGRSQQKAARYQADVQANIFQNQAGILQNNLNNGTQMAREAAGVARGYLQPFYDAGVSSLGALRSSVSPQSVQPFEFQADPGYKFRRSEGTRGLVDRAAAGGSRLSGGAMRDIMNYNSGLASQEYGNAFNRYLAGNADRRAQEGQRFNQLASIVGTGANAAGGLADIEFQVPRTYAQLSGAQGLGTSNALSDLGSGLAQSSQNSANATNSLWNNLAFLGGQASELFGSGNTNIGGVDVNLSGGLPAPGNTSRNVLSFLS